MFCSINAYCKVFLFALVLLALSSLAMATTTVNLMSPGDYANLSVNGSDFVFNFTDNDSLTLNCSLWLNYNATWSLADINESTMNDTETTFPSVPLSGEGNHSWYVNCSGTNSSVRNLWVDTIQPTVTILFPTDGSTFDPSSQNITFSIANESTEGLLVNVSAFNSTNDLVNSTANFSVLAPPNYSVQLGLPNGTYKLSAFVRDRSNNTDMHNVTGIYVGPIITQINLVSPAADYAVNNQTNITFVFNFTSTASAAMLCGVYTNNSTGGLFNVVTDNMTGNTNQNVSSTSSLWADGAYTWFANCTNISSGENGTSEIRNFTIDSTPPAITASNYTDPDNFYSAFAGNDIINFNATANGTLANATRVEAYLQSWPGNVTMNATNMTYNATTGAWTGSFNVSYLINALVENGTINGTSPGPVAAYNILLVPTDRANNTASPSGPLYYISVLLHDLGRFQGPPAAMQACFREAAGGTNMSQILNFNSWNITNIMQINGSQECHYNMTGMNESLPWGNSFRTMANFTFFNVDISTQEKAGRVMGAMGNIIRPQLSPPHSFQPSRIFVNTTAAAELNVSATVVLYDLPFTSLPTVVDDAGAAASVNISWSQGEYNESFNSTIGNLTINVSSFSGYNVTDSIAPFVVITSPVAGYNSSAAAIFFNISANGTTSEISYLSINVTNSSGGEAAFKQYYWNGTANTANCTQAANGSEVVRCLLHIPMPANASYSAAITALDYGGTAGNSNSSAVNFTYDAQGPSVVLSSPANNSNITLATPTFNYTTTDAVLAGSSLNCNLTIDGAVNRTNLTATSGTANTTTPAAALSEGSHNWSIVCWDFFNNTGSSGSYYFTARNPAIGNGTNITGSYTGLNVTVNGSGNSSLWQDAAGTVQAVNISSGSGPVLTFAYNFSIWLNFSAINITNGTQSGASYLVIQGVNSTGGLNGTKTAYIYSAGDYTHICVKDSETGTLPSSACSGAGETSVACSGTASGITCTKSGTTLAVSGLAHSAILQYTPASGGGGTTSSNNNGGGNVGGGSVSSSLKNTTLHTLHIGTANCTVSLTREMASATSQSVLTITLENLGGLECSMADFAFTDDIPLNFSSASAIAFSPAYSELEGQEATFAFSRFSGGESKTITYTVAGWVPTSRARLFGDAMMSASIEKPAVPAAPPKQEEKPNETEPPSVAKPKANATKPTSEQPAPQPAPSQQQDGTGALAAFGVLIVLAVAVVGYLLTKRKRR